jgi:hypothetical protein
MARAARDHCDQGDVLTRREKKREEGHDAVLTTPGCYDDDLRPRIGNAEAESGWRRARSMAAAQIRAAQGHGEKLER